MQATLTRPSGPKGPGIKTAIGYSDGRCAEKLNNQPKLQCIHDAGHEGLHETEAGLKWR